MKIHTKTGDEGTSSLYTGERRQKRRGLRGAGGHGRAELLIGVAREHCRSLPDCEGLLGQLETIQSRLLDVGSAVATPPGKATATKVERAAFPTGPTEDLESWIDAYDETLPPLRNFILPSGGLAASFLHLARTTCRRAERRIVPLVREENIQTEVCVFMNRLSDYLFTAARFAARQAEEEEVVYKKS